MDTDDLSDKTYKALMIEAEKFDHNLTLQFRLLSYDCKDEKDFIAKSELLIIITICSKQGKSVVLNI